MNSHQRRKVIRAVSRDETFPNYDRGRGYIKIINAVKWAERQGGRWGPYCRKAAALVERKLNA